jgi:hypothetical protein
MTLLRITAPHFCAGLDLASGRTASILRYMHGWPLARVRAYCRARGWLCEVMP